MRADLAPLLVSGVYLVPGLLLVWALGLVRATPGGVLAGLGLGYVVGVAAVLQCAIVLLCLGVAVRTPVITLIAAVLSVGALAAALRWRRRPGLGRLGWPAVRAWPVERWIVVVTLAALG